jgi:hypothetical protein
MQVDPAFTETYTYMPQTPDPTLPQQYAISKTTKHMMVHGEGAWIWLRKDGLCTVSRAMPFGDLYFDAKKQQGQEFFAVFPLLHSPTPNHILFHSELDLRSRGASQADYLRSSVFASGWSLPPCHPDPDPPAKPPPHHCLWGPILRTLPLHSWVLYI